MQRRGPEPCMAEGLGSLRAGWKEAEERKEQKSSKSSKKLLDRKEAARYNGQVANEAAVQKNRLFSEN